MRRELGLTILLIEHDMKVVMGISDQVVGARLWREDRRGHAARDPAQSEGHRGLSRAARRRERRRERRPRRHGTADGRVAAGASERNGYARGPGHPHLLRQHPGAQGRLAGRQPGGDRHPDRRQRRWQDDDAAHHLRAAATAHGLISSTASASTTAGPHGRRLGMARRPRGGASSTA